MDQSSRIAELDRFKAGVINILVCSDVAARGLDIKGVSHVFNYDTPWHPDDYVHRIGRTGRAGATGRAFTFVAPEDAEAIANVEKLTGGVIPVYALDGAPGGASEAGEERPARAAKPRREAAPRKEAPRKEASREDAPREEAPREEAPGETAPRAASQRRAPRAERPRPEPRPEPRHAEPREEQARSAPQRRARAAPAAKPVEDGEWNGPVPGFLGVSALD
jgi:superfamily II DNA/RNA helicase